MGMESIVGAGISGGASLIGGMIEEYNAKAAADKERDFQLDVLRGERKRADSFVQRRVADAKKAGVHPLYALGAPVYQPGSVSVGSRDTGAVGRGVAQAGQDVARAVSAQLTAEEKMGVQLDLEGKAIANDKDQAIADYYRSEAARNTQSAYSNARMPDSVVGARDSGPYGVPGVNFPLRMNENVVEYVPSEQKSRRKEAPYIEAARKPGFVEYETANGTVLVPSEELAEILEGGGPFGSFYSIYKTLQANAMYNKEKGIQRRLEEKIRRQNSLGWTQGR